MNYGQLLLDHPTDPAQVTDFAGNVLRESERMAVIVRNLLSFARQESETFSPAQLADIVRKTLSLVQVLLRKDQITVRCEIPEGLPAINCRSQQIQQVLMNLLTNARDALNERYPKTDPDKIIRILASTFEKNGTNWARLTVEDHGGGIRPDVAARVFDPFFTTKGRDKGTGLGLSISHGIVKEHKGTLWFETDPDQGTRFHVDLPVDDARSLQDGADA
jgi:signal transduction histidine kinase